MGNYYAGMMNNTGGYGELKHHGILGQKWGIRRFQNADGSLTAAGRERYGSSGVSDKDRKKLTKMIAARPRDVESIKKLPFIQNAAKQLHKEGNKAAEASKEFDGVRDELDNYIFDNEKRYEKWLNKAVDNYMRDENPDEKYGSREDIYNWFKYDDGDQNERGTIETYLRESKEPMAKKYLDAENKSASAYSELRKKADSVANDILGDGPDTNMNKFWTSVFIQDAAKEYDSKHSPETNEQYAKSLEKDYNKYKRLQGTKSLLGGDHSKDESVKILKEYHDEIYANKKKIRKSIDVNAKNRDADRAKDKFKDMVSDIAQKHIDKYARAMLKDMGYEVNDSTVAWLKQQYWFGMPGARDIIFD